jgi:hypothetical protein
MTTEELLKPRYEVIADYPNSNLEIGRIIGHSIDGSENIMELNEWLDFHKKYPAIFKLLEWWEKREEKDLPEYVKLDSGEVFKVTYLTKNIRGKDALFMNDGKYDWFIGKNIMCFYEPATEEEYTNYLSQ